MPIRSFNNIQPQIHPSAYVDDSAVVIGDVEIGEDSSIWPMAVVRGDIHKIIIGARSNVQDGAIIHVTHAGEFNPEGHPVMIGNNVIIGHQAVVHGANIADFSLIGIGARVLDGVNVQSHVILGAGSLVPPGKTLESGYLWLGSPAKKIRPLTEQEQEFLQYSSRYYVDLQHKHK